ncbi:hypothetical protein GCM10023318_06060 [Nocardia callitridis]|uniref:Uncharacterized protein n=1 Tax=Nocardia callitridis TaxID=648753 RepID=A0ABP9JTT4_9NOCA
MCRPAGALRPRACAVSARNCAAVSGGNASPITKTARSEAHWSAVALAVNTVSIEGTKSVTVTWCAAIRSAIYNGSRCPSGEATTSFAPTSNGRKNPHSDTSNVVAVFWR